MRVNVRETPFSPDLEEEGSKAIRTSLSSRTNIRLTTDDYLLLTSQIFRSQDARQFLGDGSEFFADTREENAGAMHGAGAGFATREKAERVWPSVQCEVLHFTGAECLRAIRQRTAHPLAQVADRG